MDPGWHVDPVIGWRVWNLAEREDGPVLQPAGSGTDEWPTRRPLEARCAVPRVLTGRRRRHEAPDLQCRCGIHASDSLDVFPREWPAWPPAPVVGRVALWGPVVAHERGWRARFAYPDRLRLVCIWCAWIEPGPGEPSVVHSFRGRLYTLCGQHGGGFGTPDGRASRPTREDASTLQARLLEAYAVDLLPAEPLVRLYRRPPAPEPPGYFPAVRLTPGGGHRGRSA
jgi:hypothetical protein